MVHQLESRVAVDGKRPVSKPDQTSNLFAQARRLTFAAVAFFMTGFAASTAHAQASAFAGLAGTWSGGGTVTLEDGSSERIRCRATYRVAGPNMEMVLTCASDAYKFNLQAAVVAQGGDVSGTWSETSRNVGGTIQGRGAAAVSRWSPAPPASTRTSRCGLPAKSRRSPCGPTASSAPPTFRCRSKPHHVPREYRVPSLTRRGLSELLRGFLDGLGDQQGLLLVERKILHARCVVSDSTMISGCCSGQPVANAVTKSAEVDRWWSWARISFYASDARVRAHAVQPFGLSLGSTPGCSRARRR